MEAATDKRSRILSAAMEVFGERPFHQVKMEEIAERAGVGKGTVYGYFSGKEELFKEMMHESSVVYFREALAAVSDKRTVQEKLHSLFHHHLHFIEKHAAAARILAGERRLPRPGIEATKERHKRVERFVADLLTEGIERGEFRRVDIDVVSQIIMGTFTALWISVLFGEHSLAETEEVVDKILDFYLHGLTA